MNQESKVPGKAAVTMAGALGRRARASWPIEWWDEWEGFWISGSRIPEEVPFGSQQDTKEKL